MFCCEIFSEFLWVLFRTSFLQNTSTYVASKFTWKSLIVNDFFRNLWACLQLYQKGIFHTCFPFAQIFRRVNFQNTLGSYEKRVLCMFLSLAKSFLTLKIFKRYQRTYSEPSHTSKKKLFENLTFLIQSSVFDVWVGSAYVNGFCHDSYQVSCS